MRLLPIWVPAFAATLLLTTWPAAAQMSREDIALRDQIYTLQQQVQTLQQEVAQQGSGSSYNAPPSYQRGQQSDDLVAELLTQVQALQEQVRDLRGEVADTQHELQQQTADLNQKIGDLAFQAQHPGQTPPASGQEAPPAASGTAPTAAPTGAPAGGAAAASAAAPQANQALSPPPAPLGALRAPPPAQPAAAKPAAPVHLPPEAAVRQARAALRRHDYPQAEADTRDVLNHHRTSPQTYDAQYLLAEALKGQHEYAKAAIAYDDAYNRNRKGSLAPDSLVGLAYTLAAINENRAACDTVAKLHAEFPHQSTSVRDAAESVYRRAACH